MVWVTICVQSVRSKGIATVAFTVKTPVYSFPLALTLTRLAQLGAV